MSTANEKLADEAIHHAVDLAGYSNGVVRRILALLNRTDADLFAQLMARLDAMDPEAFTVERLESLLISVRQMNKAVYDRAGLELGDELRALTAAEASYHHELLRSVLPAQLQVAAVSVEQVYAAAMARPFQGRLLREWAADIGEQRMTRVRDALRIGYVENKTVAQMVREIRGTRARGYSDGLIEIDRRGAEAVVRTAISHTAATVREGFYEANPDLIKAVVWRSTLDTRTSSECRIRDGKRYTLGQRPKPIGHELPWGGGPGKLHWNAVPAGTLVRTKTGSVPIEMVAVGSMVLTHRGRWRPVSQLLSKQCESGVIRIAHTQSGRRLSATYDHPILTSSGWKFMGALEVGDNLVGNEKGLDEIGGVRRAIDPEAKYNPSFSDDSVVALARSLQLVPSDINLECDLDVRAREVEDSSVAFVLWNPERIESDKCAQHHLLAVAHALKKLGRHRLSDLLANFDWDGSASAPIAKTNVCAAGHVGRANFFRNPWHATRIAIGHAFGVLSVGLRGLFGLSVSPMIGARGFDTAAGRDVEIDLIDSRAHSKTVPAGVCGQAPVCKPVLTLDVTKGPSANDVLIGNEGDVMGFEVCHDPIVALEMQAYQGLVYDLSVDDDASYFADGLAVSNCRSTASPVMKSFKELGGEDIESFTPAQRASMDGGVPADLSYSDWLKRQSAARQDEVLGPVRGKLLRDGGIAPEGFATDKGKWLSLDQLRERNAAAFKRAGL